MPPQPSGMEVGPTERRVTLRDLPDERIVAMRVLDLLSRLVEVDADRHAELGCHNFRHLDPRRLRIGVPHDLPDHLRADPTGRMLAIYMGRALSS